MFFAILSPLTAKATPYLMKYASGGDSGIAITITRQVSYVDSYAQWIKNLGQIGMMLVIFASAGLIATERASGTAALVVTKPVSRSTFAIAKYVAQATARHAVTARRNARRARRYPAGVRRGPGARLFEASGAWLALALLGVAIAEALSAVLPTVAAAIVALLGWALAGIAGLWQPALDYSPVGLLGRTRPRVLAGKSRRSDVAPRDDRWPRSWCSSRSRRSCSRRESSDSGIARRVRAADVGPRQATA